jgi:hypothetical protein
VDTKLLFNLWPSKQRISAQTSRIQTYYMRLWKKNIVPMRIIFYTQICMRHVLRTHMHLRYTFGYFRKRYTIPYPVWDCILLRRRKYIYCTILDMGLYIITKTHLWYIFGYFQKYILRHTGYGIVYYYADESEYMFGYFRKYILHHTACGIVYYSEYESEYIFGSLAMRSGIFENIYCAILDMGLYIITLMNQNIYLVPLLCEAVFLKIYITAYCIWDCILLRWCIQDIYLKITKYIFPCFALRHAILQYGIVYYHEDTSLIYIARHTGYGIVYYYEDTSVNIFNTANSNGSWKYITIIIVAYSTAIYPMSPIEIIISAYVILCETERRYYIANATNWNRATRY